MAGLVSSNLQFAKTYVDELTSSRFGIALWRPEPMQGGEIQLGDVGILCDGGFRRLFNVFVNAEHVWNSAGVPGGFVSHSLGVEYIDGPTDVTKAVIASPSMKLQTSVPSVEQVISAPQTIGFELRENDAALLVLLGQTATKNVAPNHPFMNDIRSHAQSWHEYAARRYRGLYAEDNLLIISGWTKTTAWHLASFHQRGPFLATVTGDIVIQSEGGVQIVLGDSESAVIEQRNSPTESYDVDTVPLPDFHLRPTDPDSPGDQCVFIRGYRTKRRSILPSFKILAASGPHRLPPRRDPNLSAFMRLDSSQQDVGSRICFAPDGYSQAALQTHVCFCDPTDPREEAKRFTHAPDCALVQGMIFAINCAALDAPPSVNTRPAIPSGCIVPMRVSVPALRCVGIL